MTEERNLYAALNNCAFVSTDDMTDPSRPFVFLFEAALLGNQVTPDFPSLFLLFFVLLLPAKSLDLSFCKLFLQRILF